MRVVRPTEVDPPTSQLSPETAAQEAAARPTKSPSLTCCDWAPLSRIASVGSAWLGGVLITSGAAVVPPVEASDRSSGCESTVPELDAERVTGLPMADDVVASWPVSSDRRSTAPPHTSCCAVGTGVTSTLGGVDDTAGKGSRTDAATVATATPSPTTPATMRAPTSATRLAVRGVFGVSSSGTSSAKMSSSPMGSCGGA